MLNILLARNVTRRFILPKQCAGSRSAHPHTQDLDRCAERRYEQNAKDAKKDYDLFLQTFAPLRETRFSVLFLIRSFQTSLANLNRHAPFPLLHQRTGVESIEQAHVCGRLGFLQRDGS